MIGARLRAAVDLAAPMLERFTDADAATPRAPGKWSRKQLLGHLIDSASNNHQRFVRAQFTNDLEFPGYEQERWVETQQYAGAPWPSLITLWREFNLHIARVMDATSSGVLFAERRTHNLHQIAFHTVSPSHPATLEYFMNDYIDHLEHHLAQFEPFPLPPPLQ